jgi:hypothetical protein
MTNAPDQVSVGSGRRLRQATRDAKLQQRAVTETGRAMFRNMPPVVRLRILGRLKKLAADAEAEITRARDHAHLRAGMMKLMTLTAMIDAAHGQNAGPATVTGAFPRHVRRAAGWRRMIASGMVMSALARRTDIPKQERQVRKVPNPVASG